ncbi:hypothetical protein [Nocardia sp. NPDC020380]|uniref:hypothetical protein n=1 Tax=Nocardia sp. NPDC020380 TaxID=3364309 RepID=UPI0037AD8F43
MLGFRRWVAPVAAVAAFGLFEAPALLDSPAAHAAPGDTQAALGGGSGIVLGKATKCSLTTIGYDNAGRLVGFTAGHCAAEGTPVTGEQFPDAGVVGTVVSSDTEIDYAVIRFDPAKVIPLRTVGATTIASTGPSAGAWDVVCQDGRTMGDACGVVWASGPGGFLDQACSSYGDSGGPLVLGDRLVGLVSGPLINDLKSTRFSCSDPNNPVHTPTFAVSWDTVRAAVDAGNSVGAGFRPV